MFSLIFIKKYGENMIRKIIKINEDLCNGCGECVTGCSEGAIAIIDGKAKLVKEEYCDGFGDCIGNCPLGAITIEERECNEFDEQATKQHLFQNFGESAVKKMEEAMRRHSISEKQKEKINLNSISGCPGKQSIDLRNNNYDDTNYFIQSRLQNWPIQIHLLPIKAPYYKNANLLLAADCSAFAYGNFHSEFMTNRITAIGCPKLDDLNIYFEKLTAILMNNDIDSVTVVYMEVPCCMGIVRLAEESIKRSKKEILLKKVKLSIKGNII